MKKIGEKNCNEIFKGGDNTALKIPISNPESNPWLWPHPLFSTLCLHFHPKDGERNLLSRWCLSTKPCGIQLQ
jgi:hypothetical protein